MDEQFEHRPLIETETLRSLQKKDNLRSAIRLGLHLTAFVTLIVAIPIWHNTTIIAFFLALMLAWVWSGLFAPFHECTHRTAFKSRSANHIGAWLAGLPFCMAPSVYRTFHFEHHRHTQNIERDPELQNDARYSSWPTGLRNWLPMAAAIGLMQLKLSPLIGFSLKSRERWPEFALWHERIDDPATIVRECRIVLAVWVLFLGIAILWIPGGWWIVFAAWFAHVFQTLWVASEHTGLALEGSILERTRSVRSNRFVRWWIWNMNYHAEHHAWPSIPWYHLGDAHKKVADDLASNVSGYTTLHRNIIRAHNTPSCDP